MTEQTFVRELERRADHVHGAPLSFDDVRGKARSIQRRRRAAAAGAVSALVAAAIVVPMALTGGSDRSAPEPAPVPPLTDTPGVSVLYDGVLTRPDGSTVPLDITTKNVVQLGVLSDGRVVVASRKPYGVQVYSPDGRLESTHEVAANLVMMSADDTLAAWVDATYRVTVLESGVAEPTVFEGGIPMPGEAVGNIDAVYGADCANGGCTVLGGDYTTTTTAITATTQESLVTSEPLRVAAVAPDGKTWAVTFPPTEDGDQYGCSGVYNPGAGTVLERSCDATLGAFSPDGAHLTSARGDNQMWGSVEVLDENLDEVLSFEPGADQVIKDWGWADAAHLLVAVVGLEGDRPDWSLLRVPINGDDPEVLQGPVPGPNAESAPLFLVSD